MPFTKYDKEHQKGRLFVEMGMSKGTVADVDFGIQIASDGRVWICINDVAALRFQPYVEAIHGSGEKET